MKLIFLFFGLYFLTLNLWSSNGQKQAIWQQSTKMNIVASWNPQNNLLDAKVSLFYQNNSPDTLYYIAFNVWANAFRNQSSAYASQLLAAGKDDFYFTLESEKGRIDSLCFIEKNALAPNELVYLDPQNLEILHVKLNKPLYPGQSIELDYKFQYKIQKLISRGGFSKDILALTQWYPKPAVYDINKWNSMPYLEQGEFYSEFCDSITVSIVLPKNYQVASTGNLISKKAFGSGLTLQELIFSENNVHDFALFASSNFLMAERKIRLEPGDSVLIQLYYTDSLCNSLRILSVMEAALKSFNQLGIYPYKTCKVVIGPQNAGEGMEYPTIAICKDTSSETIFHEIGHNWFYGIIANNERDHPWMDESLNSYFTTRFVNQFDHNSSKDFTLDSLFFKRQSGLNYAINHSLLFSYQISMLKGVDQAITEHSADFLPYNYATLLYAKGPLIFAYLNQVLGDSLFIACSKYYFDHWKYKHPLPIDLRNCFETVSKQDLSWFFDELLNSKETLDVQCKNGQYFIHGSPLLDSFWSKDRSKNPNIFGLLPERNYNNNGQKKSLISFNIPFGMPSYQSCLKLDLMPIVAYNYYDKIYVGLLLNHHFLNLKKLQVTLMPSWSFAQRKLIGYGKLNAIIFKGPRRIKMIESGVQGQSFSLAMDNQINQYYRINPYVKIELNAMGVSKKSFENYFLLNLVQTGIVQKTYANINDSNMQFSKGFNYKYFKGSYVFDNHHPINRISLKWNAELAYNYSLGKNATQYGKTWLNAVYKFKYAKDKKFFRTEFFAGVFFKRSSISGIQMFTLNYNGQNDYLFQEALLGRSENSSGNILLGKQLINGGGGMRNLIPVQATDRWMIALNNDLHLPGILPLKLYLDLGCFNYLAIINGVPIGVSKPELYYTAGLSFVLFKNTLEVFVPLTQSKQFKTYGNWNYSVMHSIGFKLNLNQLEPSKLLQSFITDNQFKIDTGI